MRKRDRSTQSSPRQSIRIPLPIQPPAIWSPAYCATPRSTSSDDWNQVAWHGTPPLTSRPNRVAAERLFVIGDASGYVEPFSGEGMATAMETALAVTPLAVEAAYRWQPSLVAEWTAIEQRLIVDQQATCRQLAWILRKP